MISWRWYENVTSEFRNIKVLDHLDKDSNGPNTPLFDTGMKEFRIIWIPVYEKFKCHPTWRYLQDNYQFRTLRSFRNSLGRGDLCNVLGERTLKCDESNDWHIQGQPKMCVTFGQWLLVGKYRFKKCGSSRGILWLVPACEISVSQLLERYGWIFGVLCSTLIFGVKRVSETNNCPHSNFLVQSKPLFFQIFTTFLYFEPTTGIIGTS